MYPVPMPIEMKIICALASLSLLIVMTNHFIVALPLSAVSKEGGQKVAFQSLVMALKTLPAVTVFTILLLLLSSIISIPELGLYFYNTTSTDPSNYVLQCVYRILSAVWHGALSMFIFPFSIALPCELLRNRSKVSE